MERIAGRDPERFMLSETEHERLFGDIVSDMFEGIERSNNPVAIFVGGQPGAGKTPLQNYLEQEINAAEPGTVCQIIGDDLRAYHPEYTRLLSIDDMSAAFARGHGSRPTSMCLLYRRF